MFSLGEFGRFIGDIAEHMERQDAVKHRALEKGARIVERRAKQIIGHYQENTGPFAPWADLAQATVDDKERKGFGPPDNPLLREGDMRASIEHTVEGDEAWIGSDSNIAVYQELGTSKMPPRSFLGAALFQTAPEVAHVMGQEMVESYFPPAEGELGNLASDLTGGVRFSPGGSGLVGALLGGGGDEP